MGLDEGTGTSSGLLYCHIIIMIRITRIYGNICIKKGIYDNINKDKRSGIRFYTLLMSHNQPGGARKWYSFQNNVITEWDNNKKWKKNDRVRHIGGL